MSQIEGEKQLVIFKIGNESFGVDIFEVREIIKHENITLVPEVENYVEGIINLRGKVIMLINLAKRLGVSFKEESKDTRTVVVETKDTFVGMRVDSVDRVLKISKDKIQTPPKAIIDKIHDEFIEGVAVLDSELIIVLDLAKVLNNNEVVSFEKKASSVKEESGEKSKEDVTEIEIKTENDVIETIIDEVADKKTEAKLTELTNEKNEKNKMLESEKVGSKKLKESEQGFHFVTLDNKELKNVKELHDYVESLSVDDFKSFVKEDKNDFYNWLKFSVKDEELADRIRDLKNKNDLTKELLDYLHSLI